MFVSSDRYAVLPTGIVEPRSADRVLKRRSREGTVGALAESLLQGSPSEAVRSAHRSGWLIAVHPTKKSYMPFPLGCVVKFELLGAILWDAKMMKQVSDRLADRIDGQKIPTDANWFLHPMFAPETTESVVLDAVLWSLLESAEATNVKLKASAPRFVQTV